MKPNNQNIKRYTQLTNYTVFSFLIFLNSKPKQRYSDLKTQFPMSDATLSKIMKLLKVTGLIEPIILKGDLRNYIAYSLTKQGKKLTKIIKNYIKEIQ